MQTYIKKFKDLLVIKNIPPTINVNNITQFINLISPDLFNIISLVEEIKINITVKKYKRDFIVSEKSIIYREFNIKKVMKNTKKILIILFKNKKTLFIIPPTVKYLQFNYNNKLT